MRLIKSVSLFDRYNVCVSWRALAHVKIMPQFSSYQLSRSLCGWFARLFYRWGLGSFHSEADIQWNGTCLSSAEIFYYCSLLFMPISTNVVEVQTRRKFFFWYTAEKTICYCTICISQIAGLVWLWFWLSKARCPQRCKIDRGLPSACFCFWWREFGRNWLRKKALHSMTFERSELDLKINDNVIS